jgi:fructose-bisphosphate aldolase, class II
MTVATLSEVLSTAVAERRAVAGLVVLGWEDARAFVDAAEAEGTAVILQAGPGSRKHTPVPVLGKMFRHLAETAKVPIVCHIDHAYTLEECVAGIEHGFTSVMIDGSRLPIDDNIALTARVAEQAHKAGVSVEGEVGFVGYDGGALSAMTSPDDAHRFDRESGADAVAISVGNVHLQFEQTNGISFEALARIAQSTSLPLVIHGGSGVPGDVRRRMASDYRVAKFNIGTELRITFGIALRDTLTRNPKGFDRIEILKDTMPAMTDRARKVISSLYKS